MKQAVFNIFIMTLLLIGMWSSVLVVKKDMDLMDIAKKSDLPIFAVCDQDRNFLYSEPDADYLVNIINSNTLVHETRPEYIS